MRANPSASPSRGVVSRRRVPPSGPGVAAIVICTTSSRPGRGSRPRHTGRRPLSPPPPASTPTPRARHRSCAAAPRSDGSRTCAWLPGWSPPAGAWSRPRDGHDDRRPGHRPAGQQPGGQPAVRQRLAAHRDPAKLRAQRALPVVRDQGGRPGGSGPAVREHGARQLERGQVRHVPVAAFPRPGPAQEPGAARARVSRAARRLHGVRHVHLDRTVGRLRALRVVLQAVLARAGRDRVRPSARLGHHEPAQAADRAPPLARGALGGIPVLAGRYRARTWRGHRSRQGLGSHPDGRLRGRRPRVGRLPRRPGTTRPQARPMTIVATAGHGYAGRRAAGVPRLLAGLAGRAAHARQGALYEHERYFGPLPLPAGGHEPSARCAAARLIDVVERSGLTGRGGAGFPTGRKLRAVAEGQGPAVVIANGSEGEPASRKDRLLLRHAPHLVLDGISLAAFAVGASEAYLVVHDRHARLAATLDAAVKARQVAGIDQVAIQVVGIEDRYVASEQTAMVQWINGGPGLPTFAPPRTHERGVGGRPTAVNNVETLAHLALIARYGDVWFRQAGTRPAPGTALVTVSGAIARPGVYEVELGTPLGDALTWAGGPTASPQAVLVGGYFGTWLPADVAWRAPLSGPGLRSVGGAMGAGIVIVLPESACGLAETARVVRYLASEGAGQCGPCIFGLPALAQALAGLAYRGGSGHAIDQIAGLIPLIEGRGACRHPDGATKLAASALAAFHPDARRHDVSGPCSGVRRPPLLPIPGES